MYICIVRIYLKADSKGEAVKELYDILGEEDYEIDELQRIENRSDLPYIS